MHERSDTAVKGGIWASATHATPARRDVGYDHQVQQATLLIELHHSDGRTTQVPLKLTPGQVELYLIQLEQAIAKRMAAREAVTGR